MEIKFFFLVEVLSQRKHILELDSYLIVDRLYFFIYGYDCSHCHGHWEIVVLYGYMTLVLHI